MIGQEVSDARRVVLIIETESGDTHFWGVQNPTRLSWEHAGVKAGSSHAHLRATGEFRRIRKSTDTRAIESAMKQIGEP